MDNLIRLNMVRGTGFSTRAVFTILAGLLFIGTTIPGQSQAELPEQVYSSDFETDSLSSSQALSDKKYGIAINPIRTITYIGYLLNLRGAISMFAIDRHAEIAIPIQYVSGKRENLPYRFFFSEITYRRFFSHQQNGFYYSGGLRYAYMEAEILNNSEKFGSQEEHTGMIYKRNKLGIYAGVGYRHFSAKGFYWGCNIILGDYFGPETPYIQTPDDFAYNFILGSELLQIGYAF